MRKLFNKIYDYLKENFNIKEFILNIISIGIILFIFLFNLPYVVYKPGGTIELNNRIIIDNKKVNIGSYNMAYVAAARGNIPTVIASYFIKNWDLKKEEELTINNTNYDTTLKIERVDMQDSINNAIIIAYQKANLPIEIKNEKNIIYGVLENSKTNLRPLDEIISVNDNIYENLNNFKEYINTLNVGDKVSIKVLEDGHEKEKYAYVYEQDSKKIIGIIIKKTYELETKPKIEIKSKNSEVGSSGGLMLTLAIYDSITDDNLAKNKKIVGTGTINGNGEVGAIGGVKYKLLGAKKAKADIFFIPEENYEEAKKIYDKYKLKFELIKVKTFDDAIDYLNSIK